MIISAELMENKDFGCQIMPFGYRYDEIDMKLEEEEQEDVEKIEDLKEKQKRLKEEILKKGLHEKGKGGKDKPN